MHIDGELRTMLSDTVRGWWDSHATQLTSATATAGVSFAYWRDFITGWIAFGSVIGSFVILLITVRITVHKLKIAQIDEAAAVARHDAD